VPTLRQPQQALLLARRAAAVDPQAHVLDTLAESYFVNGDVQAALDAETAALEMAKQDRSYYKGQIQRFARALESPGQ